ncbi:MAG: molybdate ABC transporter substrate-binding protein [Pseudomonadota bacterium]
MAEANDGKRLVLFAPASMTDVIGEVARAYETATSNTLLVSVAGTAQLARQIEAGAPAHAIVSADQLWLDWLEQRNLLMAGSRAALVGNKLVIAVRREVENWADPMGLLTQSRFAMADPESIPAGRYAREALQSLGVWDKARGQAVYGENVRVTLRQLALGEVGAAIVYATDTAAEPQVKVAWTFPEQHHSKILYGVAAVANVRDDSTEAQSQDARDLVTFLTGSKALEIFEKAGFKRPEPR